MNIHIARDGAEVGIFPLDDVKAYLADGSLKLDDLGWHEGLPNWVELSALFKPEKPEPTWKSEPATEKQIEYIHSFGVTGSPGMTKGQASELERVINFS